MSRPQQIEPDSGSELMWMPVCQAARSAAKKNAVLEAAIVGFSGQGFDRASMDAVAARAGVSKRTLYNRFENKEGLFAALVNELAHRIVVSSTIEYRAEAPLREQLLEYAHESKALMSEPGNLRLLRAVLGEHIRNPDRVEPLLHKYSVNEYGFNAWMQAAKADGRLSGDPSVMAHLMGAMLKSVIFWPALLGRGKPSAPSTRKTVAEAIDMFLSHYGVGD